MISRSQTGSLAVILIIVISTVSSGTIGRSSKAINPKVTTSSPSLISTLAEVANGTTSTSLDSTIRLNQTNSTKDEDNDIIYLPYRPPVYSYGAPPEDDDPNKWLWEVDEIMQQERDEKDLTEFAEELEELYTTEAEDYEEEYYDEEELSLPESEEVRLILLTDSSDAE